MFAGEGDAFRTNRRFHLLAEGQPATRLSTAFDSVTLYGFDPDERPDIYGKVGNSGVSIATLDDMKVLYAGFDLCDPTTSVSMTINGPAPTILAMFLNTAIDQRVDAFADEHGREPDDAEAAEIRAWVLANVRGTVQADILKEDQGQNTCIFSTEFSLGMMADIQEWFVEQRVRNFYSVSISGYHIAEAGANPITQLAFTLANGLHLRRGVPRPRHERRRLRAQPLLLLLQRHGPRVHRDRPGRPAHLGRRHARALRRRRALAEAEVPRADVGPVAARAGDGVQRHPHHAAGALRDLRQLQQPAHQRLRRGRHHADRRVGAPGARDPDDHQPRVGPGDEREPAAGLVHRRGAHRPGRGGGARRARAHQRARRRARRDGDRLPARPHPGRVDALRAAQARRHAADHRRQHVPQPRRRRRRRARRARARPLRRRREAVAAPPPARLPGRATPTSARPCSTACATPPSPATTCSRC